METPIESSSENEPFPNNLNLRLRYAVHAIDDPKEIERVAQEVTEDMRSFFKPNQKNIFYIESASGQNKIEALLPTPGYKKYKELRKAAAFNFYYYRNDQKEPTDKQLNDQLKWLEEVYEPSLPRGQRYLYALFRAHDQLLSEGLDLEIVSSIGKKKADPESDNSNIEGFKSELEISHLNREEWNKDMLNDIYQLSRKASTDQTAVYAVLGLFHYGIENYIPSESKTKVSSSFASQDWDYYRETPHILEVDKRLIENREISDELWQQAYNEAMRG